MREKINNHFLSCLIYSLIVLINKFASKHVKYYFSCMINNYIKPVKFTSKIQVALMILVASAAAAAIWSFYIAVKDTRISMERNFTERVNLVSTYITMIQQQVDGMARAVKKNYGSTIKPETSYARFYKEYSVWGLSGYSSDKGTESIPGTCTGTGKFPLPDSTMKELAAVLSVDPQIESILAYNKNVTWIYYTSAQKFLYLSPKLKISEYQFSLSEYKRPFWY